MLAAGRREIFEQLDLMACRSLQHRDQDFRACDAGDFGCKLTGLMCPMGKLETEDIAPESQRSFEI
jgi:hypothetical protein